MGGYVVYRAVLAEPAIRAAVSILGSPEWPHGDSPHRHLDGFRSTALLSITAERDVNVPPAAARELHRRLEEAEPGSPMHRYVELPGAVHLMSEEHWNRTMDETLRWLTHHLR
jgi:pimeloyl-ACP methyl ester carboxylesterase